MENWKLLCGGLMGILVCINRVKVFSFLFYVNMRDFREKKMEKIKVWINKKIYNEKISRISFCFLFKKYLVLGKIF